MASIEKSLQRLRTDHVDVSLIHWLSSIGRIP
jgi:aryl-alcohol dehydrogenase-like predicted oxidoreductase